MGLDKPNYTQVANLILDDLMKYMSGAELKVVLVISRQTLGYHREKFPMTISTIEELTGLSRPAVVEAIDVGERRNLIKREQLANGRWAYSLVINDEVLAASKENLPVPVKKVNQDSGKESLPKSVKKVNRRSKKSLPKSVKKSSIATPVLKKEKESIKEMVGSSDPTNQLINGGGDLPEPPANGALANALLLKMGLTASTAKRIAGDHSFVEIRRQVAGWLPDREAGKADTGALIWRIESGEWSAPELSAEFKRSELYRQFRSDAEHLADEAAEREAQQRIAELERDREGAVAALSPIRESPESGGNIDLRGSPLGAALDIDELWHVSILPEIAGQLELTVGANAFAGSHLRHEGELVGLPFYKVYVVDGSALAWLNDRTASLIRRTLSSHLRTRIEVEIVAGVAENGQEDRR